jgi:hypothetical protein
MRNKTPVTGQIFPAIALVVRRECGELGDANRYAPCMVLGRPTGNDQILFAKPSQSYDQRSRERN